MRHIQQAGGIVIGPDNCIAIITSKTRRKTFPKGSQAAGEQLIDTARREIYEETGLNQLNLIKELGEIVRPGFTDDNLVTPSVMKHIHMYYFKTGQATLQPQADDVLSAEWIATEKVAGMLSWPEETAFFMDKHDTLEP